MNEPTKCGGCGADRSIGINATVTNCPHCGSGILVTNFPIMVTHAPVFPTTTTITVTTPKEAA